MIYDFRFMIPAAKQLKIENGELKMKESVSLVRLESKI